MTPEKLIMEYSKRYPDEHFFDEDTLAFFGEKVSEMRIADRIEEVEDYCGDKHDCFVLVTYQHNAPSFCPAFAYHYFDVNTFEHIVA